MHRQVFKTIFQNPEYVKTHCIDSNIPFSFACRKLFNQLNKKLCVIFQFHLLL